MAELNLPNIREGGNIRFRIGLEDGGVAVDWSGLEDIRVFLYADAQKQVSGECTIEVDAEDNTVLACLYSGDDVQFRGINSVLVRAKYMGDIKVYDKPAINIVARTSEADGVIVVDDPVVPVQISVEDVSTSLLNNAIDAAIRAAAEAEAAAHLVPLQVLEDCVEATGKALEAASKAPYIDETTGNWFVWDAEAGEYVDSGKTARGATGNGIASWSVVESAEDAGNNVVTVTFTDGTSESFNVKNGHTGNGIASIVQTVESPDDAGTNVITITMTNGTVVTFNVKNGSKGTPGVAQAAYKSVSSLPTASAQTMDKIYLTPSGTSGVYNMSYTEFDGSAYSWQDLGTTAIQLSDYATKAELDQLEAKVCQLPIEQAGYWSNSQNTYVTSSGRSVFIPMVGYSTIRLKGPSTGNGFYAFVDSFTPNSVTFIAGVSGVTQVQANVVTQITVPPSAKYLMMMLTASSGANVRMQEAIADGYRNLYLGQLPDLWENIDGAFSGISEINYNKVGFGRVDKHNMLVWESGVRTESGIVSNSGFFHAEFNIKRSDRLVITMPYQLSESYPAILKKMGENSYTTILSFSEPYGGYSFVADADMTICINFRNNSSTFDGSSGVVYYAPSIYGLLEDNNEGFVQLSVGKNLINPAKITDHKYMGATGSIYDSQQYCITDYIPFKSGKIIVSRNEKPIPTGGGYHCLYNENYEVVRSYQPMSLNCGAIPWEEGVAFVRFSIPYDGSLSDNDLQAEMGEYPTRFVPFGEYVPGNLLEEGNDLFTRFNHYEGSGEIGNGESVTLPATYVRSNLVLSAIISGTIESVDIGQGDGVYAGGHFSVNASALVIGVNSYPHGLTLTGRTVIIMSRGENKQITIVSSSGDMFQKEYTSTDWGGAPYIKNNGSSSIDVALTFMPKNITKKIWLFGDSYMGTDIPRWPYWILHWGISNFMIDALPGGGSLQMNTALKNDLSIGQPDYAVWGLGMNDGTDTTATNLTSWINYITQFITMCIARGITPILATVPSVPSRNNESKNAWVRNSGFRYIDFAKAVNAQADGTWDAGLLSSDNIHPTEEGAKVLASQVLIDFPEIAYQ